MALFIAHECNCEMHTPCTSSIWAGIGLSKELGSLEERSLPRITPCSLCPHSRACRYSGSLGAPRPLVALWVLWCRQGACKRGKLHMKIRSREVITCLWLISAPKPGISTVSPPWLKFCLCTINPHLKCRVQLCPNPALQRSGQKQLPSTKENDSAE